MCSFENSSDVIAISKVDECALDLGYRFRKSCLTQQRHSRYSTCIAANRAVEDPSMPKSITLDRDTLFHQDAF